MPVAKMAAADRICRIFNVFSDAKGVFPAIETHQCLRIAPSLAASRNTEECWINFQLNQSS
jgi:hypothetical protein